MAGSISARTPALGQCAPRSTKTRVPSRSTAARQRARNAPTSGVLPIVLVVDDDPQVVRLLAAILSSEGFAVEQAAHGAEGLAMATCGTYAAVVLDDRLPVLSGLETLRHLRAAGNRVPTIFLTGFPNRQRLLEVTAFVGTEYLAKPIDKRSFLDCLRRLVEGASGIGPLDPPAVQGAVEDRDATAEFLRSYETWRPSAPRLAGEPAARASVLAQLGRLIATTSVSFFVFAAGCRGFRLLRSNRSDGTDGDEVGQVYRMVAQAFARDWSRVHSGLAQFVAGSGQLATSLRSKHAVAAQLRLTVRETEILVTHELGLGLPIFRLIVRVRPVIVDLARSTEHVAQIGYSHGYERHSQVDHDFRRLLNVTPTEFRALIRRHSVR